jgi:hypothetical protein
VRNLGEVVERAPADLQQVLAQEVPCAALSGYLRDSVEPVLRQRRLGVALEETRMRHRRAAGNDLHALLEEEEGSRNAGVIE